KPSGSLAVKASAPRTLRIGILRRDISRTARSLSQSGHRCTFRGTSALSKFINLRLRLLQPEPHVHLAVHRRRSREVLLGVLQLAHAPVELAEPEVAVGDEGAHAELDGECQRLAVVAFGVRGAACRRDVTGEAEGVGLASPS